MKNLFSLPPAGKLALQAILAYGWLTVLSPLAVSDTYYSVYLLCGVFGLLCLLDNHRAGVPQQGRRTAAFFGAVFACAVALANYALFEPLSVLQNLFDLVCVFLGGWVVGDQILLAMLRRLPLSRKCGNRKHPNRVFWVVFASIGVIDLTYLFFALYPGVLTTDSFSTIGQILGTEPYNNTMPFWHTVTVEPFVELGLALFEDINGAIALYHAAQALFMAACFAYAIVTMYQAGVPAWFMLAVFGIYAFMPYNIVYSVTLWKDIPFAGAGVLFVTALYRLLKGIGRRKINICVFALGALGFSLWRTNGWYAFLVMTMLMFLMLRKTHKQLLVMMVSVLVVCWVLINPVLSFLNVGATNLAEAFAVPMQQIARVLHEERELTQEEKALLSEIFWIDKTGQVYDPQTVDPVKFETFRYDKVDYLAAHKGEYFKLYFSLGARYPGDYLKAWVEETKGYWNGGYKYWTYTLQMGENGFGIYQTPGENIIARLYAALFRYLEKPAVLQWTVSIGLHVWALVSCCVVNAVKKREEFLLTIPILVLMAGLWLGTPVFAEWRYAYPLILTMPVILATTCFTPE